MIPGAPALVVRPLFSMVGFAGLAWLVGLVLTDNQPEFFEIREAVLLEVMETVEEARARLALPTEIHYVRASELIGGQQTPA